MASKAPSVEEIRARLAGQNAEKREVEATQKRREEIVETGVIPQSPDRPTSLMTSTSDLRTLVKQTLAAHNLDPVVELIDMYEETDAKGNYVMSPKDRKSLMLELLKYIAPQLKAMDIQSQISGSLSINVVQFKPEDAIPMRNVTNG